MIVKTYKYKKRIICYIVNYSDIWRVCTGKPSDKECLSWAYNNISDAENTASEYFYNYINI